MSSALIVAKSEKTTQSIMALLKEEGYIDLETADSAADAKKYAEQKDFDLVFIYTPLTDEVGLNLSIHIGEYANSGVFIAVSGETAARAGEKLSVHGVVTLVKPITVEAVHQSVLALRALKCRIGIMERENEKLKIQLEQIKVINRAKCVLMQCLNMTEQQAHKYLEKQAMDLRVSKKYVAEQVLNTYEI